VSTTRLRGCDHGQGDEIPSCKACGPSSSRKADDHREWTLLCPQVQSPHDRRCVNAVQLSQATSLSAWSIGDDGALVCTDVTTCQVRTSTNPTCIPPPGLQDVVGYLFGISNEHVYRIYVYGIIPGFEVLRAQYHHIRQVTCL
jgi:hypothetical protein